MSTAREITREFAYCATPERHPDECACPLGSRDIERVPGGIDRWDDKEQPR